jgi:hypothetical protein
MFAYAWSRSRAVRQEDPPTFGGAGGHHQKGRYAIPGPQNHLTVGPFKSRYRFLLLASPAAAQGINPHGPPCIARFPIPRINRRWHPLRGAGQSEICNDRQSDFFGICPADRISHRAGSVAFGRRCLSVRLFVDVTVPPSVHNGKCRRCVCIAAHPPARKSSLFARLTP